MNYYNDLWKYLGLPNHYSQWLRPKNGLEKSEEEWEDEGEFC